MVAITSQKLQETIKLLEDDLLNNPNRNQQQNQLLKEIQEKDYSSTGLFGQYLQGVSRRSSDEITATGDTNPLLIDALRNTENIQNYRKAINSEPITERDVALALKRKNLSDYGARKPFSSTLAEGAGAITSLLPFGKKKIIKGLVNPKNFGQGVIAGFTEGGLSSYFGGEDDVSSRMYNVPIDATISAGLGGIFSTAANLFSPIVKQIVPQSARNVGTKTAKKMIDKALKADNLTIGEAIEMIVKKKDSSFSIGDTSDQLRNLIEGINLLPSTSGNAGAKQLLKARSEGRIGRILGIFDNVTGGNYINELQVLQGRKKNASKLYTNVLKNNKKMDLNYSMKFGDTNISIMNLLNQSSMVDALEAAAKIAKNIDPKFNMKFIRNDVGDIIKIQTADKRGRFNDVKQLDTKLLHYIKLGLDDSTSRLGRDSSIGTVLKRQAYDTKNKFNALLDSFNPRYKVAKNAYAEMYSLSDAMFQGRNLKKALNNPQELELLQENIKYMGKSEKEAFFLGAMQYYKDVVNSTVGLMKADSTGGRNIAEKLIENPTAIELLKTVYPGSVYDFPKFLSKLKDEAIVQANTIKATGGSPTAVRSSIKDEIAANIPKKVLNARNMNDVIRTTIGEAADEFTEEVTNETSKELMNILFTTAKSDPKKLKALNDAFSGKITLQKVYEQYPEFLQAILKGPFKPQMIAAIQTNTGIGEYTRPKVRGEIKAVKGLFEGTEF